MQYEQEDNISSLCSTFSSTSQENCDLKQIILKLSRKAVEMGKAIQELSHQQQQNNNVRAKKKRPTSNNDDICWYHYRFKKKAHTCIKPCNFKEHLNAFATLK